MSFASGYKNFKRLHFRYGKKRGFTLTRYVAENLAQTKVIGSEIAKSLSCGQKIALHGSLGAGKTVLAKAIAAGLGVSDNVNSPTYTIIQEYNGRLCKLFHMDLYRIESYEDFIMTGGEEILQGDGICLIEWAEKIFDDLPEHTIHIYIKITGDSKREICVDGLV